MTDYLPFDEAPRERPAYPLIIETPGAIVIKARASELINRALQSPDEAESVLNMLEAEVMAMKMPSRFSRSVKLSQSPHRRGYTTIQFAGLTEDDYKRKQLLVDLQSVRAEILQHGIAKVAHKLESVICDIEAAKQEEFFEQTEGSSIMVKLQGQEIELEKIDQVFSPSEHGLFLGEHIRVNPGESVIDIGAGSGIFAILAKRLGGENSKVFATEITREAVEMVRFNAALNHTKVDVRSVDPEKNSFFPGLEGKFDVLIANLPQKMILKKREPRPAFDARPLGVWGGTGGNEILLSFLEEAKNHMHANSRLYIQIYGLTYYNQTLSKITWYYDMKELAKKYFIEDGLISNNLDGYMELLDHGQVDVVFRDGHYYVPETAYELRLRKP